MSAQVTPSSSTGEDVAILVLTQAFSGREGTTREVQTFNDAASGFDGCKLNHDQLFAAYFVFAKRTRESEYDKLFDGLLAVEEAEHPYATIRWKQRLALMMAGQRARKNLKDPPESASWRIDDDGRKTVEGDPR